MGSMRCAPWGTALTFGLGLGVAALATSAVAYAEPTKSAADSSTSSAAAAPSQSKAGLPKPHSAKTKKAAVPESVAVKSSKPAARKAVAAPVAKSADTAYAVATPANPSGPAVPAEPLLDPVTTIRLAVDSVVAQAARVLGYAPINADNANQPLLPLRDMLLGAFATFRRATDTDPSNALPALDPKELYQFVTGEVVGDLLPSDTDGDPLTYQVVQGPTNGTLVVNANGTYYYKPNTDFAETGGTDTFVVVAGDGQQGQTVVPVNIEVQPTLGISETFWFRNYTLAPLKFTGYNGGTGDLDSGPATGTVILPGGEASWAVTWYLFSVGSVTPQFSTVGFGATPSDPGYIPAGLSSNFQLTFKTKPRETQCSSGGEGQCNVVNDRLAVALNKGNPVVTLDAADSAKIAAVLSGICNDSSQASCSYNATSQVAGFTGVRTIGIPVTNETSIPTTYSIAIADQVSQTDSVGISVKLSGGALAKLASIINVEITTNYGHSWTNTHTFTQTINVPVRAGYTAWIEGSAPVWRVTGDFTIKLGNSTYQLNGATFDTPNPNGIGSYVIKDRPIGSAGDGAPGTSVQL
jgi:hypothetical protein